MMLDRSPPTPAEIDTGLSAAANLWTLIVGIGGAVIGGYGVTLRKGRAEGALATKVTTMGQRIEELETEHESFRVGVKADLDRLGDSHDKIRDKLSDIRATMVQRADLQQLASSISTAMDGLRTRMDTMLNHK